MGKKPIVSVTYDKNSLPYMKCVLRLSCVVHGPIYSRFMGCTGNGFLSIYKVYGNAEFKPRFCRWLQTGKVAEIGDL